METDMSKRIFSWSAFVFIVGAFGLTAAFDSSKLSMDPPSPLFLENGADAKFLEFTYLRPDPGTELKDLLFNNTSIPHGSFKLQNAFEQKHEIAMKLAPVTKSQSGTYTAVVKGVDDGPFVGSKDFEVVVYDPIHVPNVVEPEKMITVGDNISFSCDTGSESGTRVVRWSVPQDANLTGPYLNYDFGRDLVNLTIHNASGDNSGSYICFITKQVSPHYDFTTGANITFPLSVQNAAVPTTVTFTSGTSSDTNKTVIPTVLGGVQTTTTAKGSASEISLSVGSVLFMGLVLCL